MKNKLMIKQLVAVIAVLATFAACSDGELKLQGAAPSISSPPPVIVKFDANPVQVEAGGSTTLSWEVVGATSVEISSSAEGAFQFHAGPFEEATGSTTVDGITETTDFTLKATKTVEAPPSEAGSGGTATPAAMFAKGTEIPVPEVPAPSTSAPLAAEATITVVVVAPATISADISADSAQLTAGESTILRWTVVPDTAQVSVTSSSEEAVVAAAECETATGTAEGFSATGCASVAPLATTTYTVTATMADGKTATDAVTIEVATVELTADITINGQKNATVTSFREPVQVAWTVAPENAKVTVSASSDATCTPELPQAAVSTTGSASCTISSDTTFSITAELGGASDTDDATVSLQAGQTADAVVTTDSTWAFAGEKITVTVDPDAMAGGNRSAISGINIGGTNYTLPVSGPLVVSEVVVPVQGLDVSVVSTSNLETKHTKIVHAVNPTILPITGVKEFSRIVFDNEFISRAYVGVEKEGYNKGVVNAYKINTADASDFAEWKIDISKTLLATAENQGAWKKGKDKDGQDVAGLGFFEMVHDYPVSALAVDGDKIFLGTTGALMYSDDAGVTWKKVTTFLRFNADDHKTCGGETQAGNGQKLGSLGRACDLIFRNNHLIIATDRGVLTITNVDSFLESRDAEQFVAGRPPKGQIDATKYPTYGFVANDLEATDDAVYAATEKGIFKSTDDGITWEKMSGLDEEVFAVAVSKADNKIYAGTAQAVKSRSLAEGSWETKEIGQQVNSLATDPYQSGVVLAGTAGGLYVSRDGGSSWTAITTAGFEGKLIRSVALAAKETDDGLINYSLSFGGQGAAMSNFTVGRPVAAPPAPQPVVEPSEPTQQ